MHSGLLNVGLMRDLLAFRLPFLTSGFHAIQWIEWHALVNLSGRVVNASDAKLLRWIIEPECRKQYQHTRTLWCVNPRPAGVWLVTRPAGGGGPKGPPPLRSPKLLDRFPNFKRHSIALYVNYPYKVKYLTRRSLMTSQVRSKSEFSTFRAWRHRRVKFRC